MYSQKHCFSCIFQNMLLVFVNNYDRICLLIVHFFSTLFQLSHTEAYQQSYSCRLPGHHYMQRLTVQHHTDYTLKSISSPLTHLLSSTNPNITPSTHISLIKSTTAQISQNLCPASRILTLCTRFGISDTYSF